MTSLDLLIQLQFSLFQRLHYPLILGNTTSGSNFVPWWPHLDWFTVVAILAWKRALKSLGERWKKKLNKKKNLGLLASIWLSDWVRFSSNEFLRIAWLWRFLHFYRKNCLLTYFSLHSTRPQVGEHHCLTSRPKKHQKNDDPLALAVSSCKWWPAIISSTPTFCARYVSLFNFHFFITLLGRIVETMVHSGTFGDAVGRKEEIIANRRGKGDVGSLCDSRTLQNISQPRLW